MNHPNATDEDRLVTAVKRYMELLDAGNAPTHDDYVRQYSDIADELRSSLEGLALVHRAASPVARRSEPLTATSPEQELAGKPIGDFQIIREIGRGGMGVVYEATQLSLNRSVALKVLPFASGLDEVRLQRFRNEANAAATLHHTNIVPVYAVGSDRGVHFYAMQLIEGITLADFLSNLNNSPTADGRYVETTVQLGDSPAQPSETQSNSASTGLHDTVTQKNTATEYSSLSSSGNEYYRTVVRMIQQAALALDHAHQYGVIHRDIKPANLLLDSVGKIWVADFGLAQVQAEQSNLTRTGDPMGTLRYMSPEQATGRRTELDHRTDVYSLGATLYELLTLQPAISDGEYHQMLNRVVHVEPPSPRSIDPSLPIELDTIVRKACAKIQVERYNTAGELANDLQAWLDDKPIAARPPSLLERASKWRRRNSGLVTAASLVLLLATVGLAISTMTIWSQQKETSAALTRETEQRKLAEQRFDLARRAVDTFSRQSETELSHRGNMQDLRRSFLETSMLFYQDFLSERDDDSDLSKDLLITRDRVVQMVNELRILDGIATLRNVRYRHVQDEIHLDSTTTYQVLDAIDQFDNHRRSLSNQFIGGLNEENAELSNLLTQLDASVQGLLSEAQLERLRQIYRQRRLPYTFKNSEIINKLLLTSEQVERIDQIIEASGHTNSYRSTNGSRRGRDGTSFGGPPPTDFRSGQRSGDSRNATTNPKNKDHVVVRQILETLTPSQRETWKSLVGEPFSW